MEEPVARSAAAPEPHEGTIGLDAHDGRSDDGPNRGHLFAELESSGSGYSWAGYGGHHGASDRGTPPTKRCNQNHGQVFPGGEKVYSQCVRLRLSTAIVTVIMLITNTTSRSVLNIELIFILDFE